MQSQIREFEEGQRLMLEEQRTMSEMHAQKMEEVKNVGDACSKDGRSEEFRRCMLERWKK
uniref:Uncharacterized protein n=1 Tax=Cucumis melo TaxID=3656 RepID=A0A9I9CK10_CUCME